MLIWISIISLIIIGLALIVVELIFIPGTTIVGILGLICIIAGLVMTFNNYGSSVAWAVTGGTAVLSAGVFIYSFRSGAWNRFALKQSMNSKVNESNPLNVEVGDEGVALSTLRPMGKAEFKNQVMEVTSLGELVVTNTAIRIIKIDKRKIIVEPIN
jgi:membrane-bound ClpP family serine protease